MQRANPEYPISRRAALLGASVVVATAGLPAAVKAMEAEAGADAQLIAMIGEWERVREVYRAVAIEECELATALMPEPPESIEGYGRPDINHMSRIAGWRTKTRRDMDVLCRGVMRSEPDCRDLIEHNHRRMIADLEAYVVACKRLYHGPALTALRERGWELMDRDKELLAAIEATRARSLAGVLRKMQTTNGWDHFSDTTADHSSVVTPRLLTSILHDLEFLAGDA